jgi:hypothetical protein
VIWEHLINGPMDCLKGLAMVGLHGDLLFTDRIKEG